MSEHTTLYGICENKCLVPVAPKTETDAVEERVTALEAGEFETVNCAGSIFANELCGKRVGIPTTTIPHNYSPTSTFSEKLDYNHAQGATTTQTYTTPTTPLEYWDLVEDGSTLTYTFKYTKCTTWSSNYIPSANVVVTNLITGATSTHTLTLGNSSVTHTLSLSPFVSVQITVTGTKDTNGNNHYSYIEISRPNVYIKAKGT